MILVNKNLLSNYSNFLHYGYSGFVSSGAVRDWGSIGPGFESFWATIKNTVC